MTEYQIKIKLENGKEKIKYFKIFSAALEYYFTQTIYYNDVEFTTIK